MTPQLQQISFAIPAKVYDNLKKRSGPLNIKVTEYARRLFEAAFAARVADERGQSSGDTALDNQVRQVFLLADCEPEYIADALHMPQERVSKILAGWRQVAREDDAKAVPPPARQGEETPAGAAGYPTDLIAKLWAEGRPLREIANAIGKTEGALSVWAVKHRDICPSRRAQKAGG